MGRGVAYRKVSYTWNNNTCVEEKVDLSAGSLCLGELIQREIRYVLMRINC